MTESAMPSAGAEPSVLLDIGHGVATITLNRPERMNAINHALMTQLTRAVRAAAEDGEVACVVLTGAGRGFCAGGDFKDGAAPRGEDGRPVRLSTDERIANLRQGAEAARLLCEMGKPAIAAINGPVAGAGIGLAAACDLRIAAASATFSSSYERIGASGDYGATWGWSRILGAGRARELFLMGEKFSAAEALAFGLYTRVVADDELATAVRELAQRFAGPLRTGWRHFKANLNAAEHMAFAEHLDLESRHMILSLAAARAVAGPG